MAPATSQGTIDNLTRLAAKPGVQSTLVLSKSDGSIIHSSGLLGPSASAPTTPLRATNTSGDLNYEDVFNRPEQMTSNPESYGNDPARTNKTAEEIARMVFTFINAAGAFVDDMGKADDVRLLRLRTRKYEIVIVPDDKFLLVVIHDAPKSGS